MQGRTASAGKTSAGETSAGKETPDGCAESRGEIHQTLTQETGPCTYVAFTRLGEGPSRRTPQLSEAVASGQDKSAFETIIHGRSLAIVYRVVYRGKRQCVALKATGCAPNGRISRRRPPSNTSVDTGPSGSNRMVLGAPRVAGKGPDGPQGTARELRSCTPVRSRPLTERTLHPGASPTRERAGKPPKSLCTFVRGVPRRAKERQPKGRRPCSGRRNTDPYITVLFSKWKRFHYE